MKKIFALIASMLVMSSAAFAGAKEIFTNYGRAVDEGDFILNIGGGLNWGYLGSEYDLWIPPVSVTGEYLVSIGGLPFGFGGIADFSFHRYKGSDGNKYNYYSLYTGPIVNYHINLPVDNLDIYAGSTLGVRIGIDHDGDLSPYVDWGSHVGATWYFNNVVGINMEMGYPYIAKLAVSLKF